MATGEEKLPTDPEQGVWRGRRVARRVVTPEGLTVLIGKSAADNDVLSIKLGSPNDFWLHVAAGSGSHVLVRNPDNLATLPRETLRLAAGLAAGYSSARAGGRTAVHVARCGDVGKPRGFAPGKVTLRRYRTVQATPIRLDELDSTKEE
jgi:predicted ribosome quality control (RQC) complex YloA/Tae2 family protein